MYYTVYIFVIRRRLYFCPTVFSVLRLSLGVPSPVCANEKRCSGSAGTLRPVSQMSPAGAGTTRSLYSGRGHTTHGGTPSSFGAVTQHAQAQGPGQQQSPMPPRPPRPGDNSGMGMDKGSWAGSGGDSSSWGSRTSPMQPMQQHLPTPPRSMGGRGAGSWDDRGGPEIMRSIHEGNPSPDAST